MAILNGLRHFQRSRDGIQIELQLDEWPIDVPLPEGSAIVGIGENHDILIRPRWEFVLESDCTFELVTGWFQSSLSLEETLNWYRTELCRWGWVEDTDRGYLNPPRAGLRFQDPDGKAHVNMSVQRWPSLNHTTAMIWRVTKHRWSPAADEPVAETPELSMPDEER